MPDTTINVDSEIVVELQEFVVVATDNPTNQDEYHDLVNLTNYWLTYGE